MEEQNSSGLLRDDAGLLSGGLSSLVSQAVAEMKALI